MNNILIYPVGSSDSCRYCASFLEQAGFSLTDHPSPEITHLLLDVPSFDGDGFLRDGTDFKELLRMLPGTVTIIGGNLKADDLQEYRTIDLLSSPQYLARNAAITAQCALQVAAVHLHTTFADSPTLILGWGRIGKCLARHLKDLGCPVTVAARKEQDRAMLEALGYEAVDFKDAAKMLPQCRLLYNTVPDLPSYWEVPGGIAIDLASYPGMRGNRVIVARGLPGKYAPESSGRLIYETIVQFCKEGIL